MFLASGLKELPPGGALLLYMSADGCFSTTKHPEDYGYELGGLATSIKRDGTDAGLSSRGKSTVFKEPHCLYPGDLYPFTRRPMFIIIDSDNSFVFQHIPRFALSCCDAQCQDSMLNPNYFFIIFQILWSTSCYTHVASGYSNCFPR